MSGCLAASRRHADCGPRVRVVVVVVGVELVLLAVAVNYYPRIGMFTVALFAIAVITTVGGSQIGGVTRGRMAVTSASTGTFHMSLRLLARRVLFLQTLFRRSLIGARNLGSTDHRSG